MILTHCRITAKLPLRVSMVKNGAHSRLYIRITWGVFIIDSWVATPRVWSSEVESGNHIYFFKVNKGF